MIHPYPIFALSCTFPFINQPRNLPARFISRFSSNKVSVLCKTRVPNAQKSLRTSRNSFSKRHYFHKVGDIVMEVWSMHRVYVTPTPTPTSAQISLNGGTLMYMRRRQRSRSTSVGSAGRGRMSESRRLEVGNYHMTTTTVVGCVYITKSRGRV